MAFDQVSVFLYPPRWERRSVTAPHRTHYSGEAVRIVSAVRVVDSQAPPLPFEVLCRWFEARSFEAAERDADHVCFCSASVQSPLGLQAEIEVSAGAEGGEVTSLYCRFLLTHETPVRSPRWEAFLQERCGTFALRISVSDSELVEPTEFSTVLRHNPNWQRFAKQFDWAMPLRQKK